MERVKFLRNIDRRGKTNQLWLYHCGCCGRAVSREANREDCGCLSSSHKATIYRPKPAERRCLMCGKNFISSGPWNRRCPVCEHKIEHSGQAYYMPPVYGASDHSTVACCWET